MICPQCGSPSKVYGTQTLGGEVTRYRVCENRKCRHRWRTLELPETGVQSRVVDKRR